MSERNAPSGSKEADLGTASISAVSTRNMPLVSGPIEGGKHGRPFAASMADLSALGYVEEEYFISGDATRYEPVGPLGMDGKWQLKEAESAPYKTRILVRRPRDPAKFNGTVLLEWLNVSLGYDYSAINQGQFDGFAFVGVSCQATGINGLAEYPLGLKTWDAERYGSLWVAGESLAFDIFTQAARAVSPERSRTVDPMGSLPVTKIIATGASQSAAKLLSYLNGVQPLMNVIDAFVPTTGVSGTDFSDAAFNMTATTGAETFEAIYIYPALVRDDLQVPVMMINSETETPIYFNRRQADTAKFVYWEVAGAPHGPAPRSRDTEAMRERDGLPTFPPMEPAASEVDWMPVADAAYQHVHRWINGGPPPPSMPKIEIEPGSPFRIRRDQLGNALGGVRLPDLDVPLAQNTGVIEGRSFLQSLGGQHVPFTHDQVRQLYPTKADYVAKVAAAAHAAEDAGVILPPRAAEYIAKADAAVV